MDWKPVGNKIIIKKMVDEKVRKSGIIIPGRSDLKEGEGTVVSVGSGRYLQNGELIPIEVKEGDVIIYFPHAGTKLPSDDGIEYLLINESDVQAVKRS